MKPGTPSEGHRSALDLLMAIGPLHGSERPEVALSPYLLHKHRFARIDTGFTREGGMAASNPHIMPLSLRGEEARS
ncbi:MAG: hypothetical protein ACT6UH_00555 [Hydrogenophaga sp.]|uniref:hypothetical protein n=1 Tax=Hydrogenophaga sp. TaxID=1904254 RepID=UPI0040358B3D